jgi:hypothetical protein
MPIEITLERRQLQLTRTEAALAKAATSRQALCRQFDRAIAAKQALFEPAGSLKVDEATLRWSIHRYSEQLVPDATAQIKGFLALQRPLYFEPGFAPLYYFTHKSGGQGLSVSKSAVAAVAEGIGALVMQRLMKARILCRPCHDYPDMIGTDAPAGSQITTSKLYLMEVKGIVCDRSPRCGKPWLKKCFDLPLIRRLPKTLIHPERWWVCWWESSSIPLIVSLPCSSRSPYEPTAAHHFSAHVSTGCCRRLSRYSDGGGNDWLGVACSKTAWFR